MVAATHADTPTPTGDISDRTTFYADLLQQARKQLKTSNDGVASAANVSALIFHAFRKHYGEKSVNWVGFYISRPKAQPEKNSQYDRVLILGPFHGQPAVSEIPYTRGVCGSNARNEAVELVKDVHAREDHIACDSASQSEIILPVFTYTNDKRKFVAQLDMDSPVVEGFTEQDERGLQPIVDLLQDKDWSISDLKVQNRVEDDDTPACTMAHKPH